MKKLPELYQNTINKKINNNKTKCYVDSEIINDYMNSNQINLFLNDLFNDIGYVFNIPVVIKTNTKTYETSLIARTNGYLLTFDNDKISISNIISIKRKNP